jgi:lipopolysaccharide/colanic/teichoic acid biosynthesis glycosyltransferase
MSPLTSLQAIIKRTMDVLGSFIGLLILAPIMGLLAIAIKIDSAGPVFYNTRRIGLNGKEFTLYKFRTMHFMAPPRFAPDGSMLVETNDPRITRVGKFLRLGFDELPQLWNILCGEMSIVGPRPDPPYVLKLYQGTESLRMMFRPGLTGLAQVRGRTDIPWRDRLAYDVQYIKNYSLLLDLKIIFLTFAEFLPPVRNILLRQRFKMDETNDEQS